MNRWHIQRLPFRWRLFFSFLTVINLSVLTVALYGNLYPFNDIENAPIYLNRLYAAQLAPVFIASHSTSDRDGWEESQFLVERLVENRSQDILPDRPFGLTDLITLSEAFQYRRIVVFDLSGSIVADSSLSGEPLDSSSPLSVPMLDQNGAQIGSIIVESGFDAAYIAGIRRRGRRAVASLSIWAGLASSIVSIILSYRLTRPLKRLTEAAAALAERGETEEIPVTRFDEVGNLTVMFNDMAGRLKLQRQLRQQMVADIAHELRTPLSIMRLELSSVIDGFQNAETAYPAIESELRTLERLISDLNLLALSDAHELELEMRELDAVDFLVQATRQWEQPARQSDMSIELQLPPQEEILIQADERRLYQILNNLVTNAFRYASQGSKLTLSLEIGDDHAVQFKVRDFGPGIPEADVPHLFDRFYRVTGDQIAETGGSGLGLAIAKRLVELHHGRIWCESQMGEGTLFVVELSHGENL